MLKDLAYTKEEINARKSDHPTSVEETSKDMPEYPWGLNFSLDEGSLKKLGMKATSFEVGEERTMTIVARVNRVESTETIGGEHSCVGLTITQIDPIGKDMSEEGDAKTVLYGSGT